MRQQVASPMRADGRPFLSDALADRCKGCVPNSLLTAKDFAVVDAMYACGAYSLRREHIR
nr:MAG TPA: hypothetical protein [Caudoviricetes sp.]